MDKYPGYITQEQQEEFESVLLNQMDSKEKAVFNHKLNSDTELKKQFEEFKELFLAIEEEGLRNMMATFHNNLKGESSTITSTKSKFHWYRIAASIAILISLGIWFFNKQSPNEKLFKRYYSVDPGLPTVMGNNDNYAFYEAMVDYKQGNYDVAINKWEKLLLTNQDSDTLNYFLGSAYLANGNTNKAIILFENTLNSGAPTFSKEAHYYMALALLKNNNIEEAIKHLKMVPDEKSQELLKKIRE
ncbi:tetratricopeptide repeat protein [Maribacter polysiphoniae]|uniref:Anaphase-promoting complex subunit 3 n=1 Tax=Maribacter polysiphoniae TaxID=429344 RepID=A0A316DUZ0_9FLAO|nr:tetratricopeptide repeat protein [Maribacter polysiphoniae]MBD1262173.1 tetratricopeptide repeat protein [Maribacter polysiphoniae]PWK21566.1 anaphase-promoting complex subunit 3 [Maribacter polysiphoniae]